MEMVPTSGFSPRKTLKVPVSAWKTMFLTVISMVTDSDIPLLLLLNVCFHHYTIVFGFF